MIKASGCSLTSLKTKKNTCKLFLLILLCLLSVSTFGTQQVSAFHDANGGVILSPDPGSIPGYIRDYLVHSNCYSKTPGVNAWLADAANPAQQTITVSDPFQTLSLGYRYIATTGYRQDTPPPCSGGTPSSNYGLELHNRIETASVSGGAGYSMTLPDKVSLTGFSNTPGFTNQAVRGVSMSPPPGGWVNNQSYTLSLTSRSINLFANGDYVCVGGTEEKVSGTTDADFARCIDSDVIISLTVTVRFSRVEVQGAVYDGDTGAAIPGATIGTCWHGDKTTDGSGNFRFMVDDGAGYCLDVTGVPANYDLASRRIRPSGEGYLRCAPGQLCAPRYECQEANRNNRGCDGSSDWDRASDRGFDFVVYKRRPPGGNMTANCTGGGRVSGTASDPDFAGSIRIQVYVDGPAGSGTFVGETTTNASRNFSLDVSAWRDWGNHNFWAYGIGKDRSGAEDGYNSLLSNSGSGSGACAPPVCGSATTDPANPEAGVGFTVRVNFIYNPGPNGRGINRGAGHVMTLSVGPSGSLYNNNDQNYDNPVPPGTGSATTGPIMAPAAGEYDVRMELSGGPSLVCNFKVMIVDKPYFRVFGGDVVAGASAFGTCTPGIGDIRAWNRGSSAGNPAYGSSPYGGAGTQLAAYATSTVDQFVSAATRGSDPVVPRGLTFANNTAATYGGNWATGNIPCQTDYYATGAPAGATDPGGSFGLNGANGIYGHSGNLTIGDSSNSNNITPNRKIVVYVDGDLAITGDIRFVGMYSGIDRVTSVRIIVRGNIYIAPNVQYIDGILIAQPNGGTGGTIVTCSNGSYGLPTVAQVNGGAPSCRTHLEVFGALIAREVRFLRSQGSIRNSNNGHNYNNATIAESIIFTPEVWLADPAYKPPYREPYEAFTSLPPIL